MNPLSKIAPAFLSLLLLVSIQNSVIAAKRTSDQPNPNKERSDDRSKPSRNKPKSAAETRTKKTEPLNAKSNKLAKSNKADIARLKRERATELRRAEAKRIEEERRAAVAREKARDEELRERVQNMIAKDDLSGEDLQVREAVLTALGKHAGTVVVMNPQTGRVYSMVNQQWAVREGFKPCSTIKLVTGLAGLNEDVIDPDDTTRISNTNQVSLTRALAYSKNGYFQEVGEQVGFEKMVAYARRLGLGEKTGINARHEFEGRLPSFNSRDNIHRMSSHGDNFEVTALQLATLVSAMGNGGKLLTPYISNNHRDDSRRTKVRRQIKMDQDSWRQMIPGMVGAVNYGSGKRAHHPTETIAGKTGTCIEDGRWVGLFTSYAPLNNPKFAVVVITRGADARGHLPAAVAGHIYRELSSRFDTPTVLQVAAHRQVNKPIVETEEDEEEASAFDERTTSRKADGIDGETRRMMMHVPRTSDPSTEALTNSGATGNGQTRPRRVSGR